MSQWSVTDASWPEEADSVADLAALVFNYDGDEEREGLRQCSGALKATSAAGDSPRMVGALVFDIKPSEPRLVKIVTLATHPDYRRQGVANILMTHFLSHMGAKNEVVLCIDPQWDAGLRNFYTKYGFTFTGETTNDNETWHRPPPVVVQKSACATM